MSRRQKKSEIDLTPFLLRIVNNMTREELIETDMAKSIVRCFSADEIFDALTPEQREEIRPRLRALVEKDKKAATQTRGTLRRSRSG